MIYSITEGQQAEEYKARKAKEAESKRQLERDYMHNRSNHQRNKDKAAMGILSSMAKKNPKEPFTKEKMDKIHDLSSKSADTGSAGWNKRVEKERSKRDVYNPINTWYLLDRARDAGNRHKRRHPEQYRESVGIFSSINFI